MLDAGANGTPVDALFADVINQVNKAVPLRPLPIDPELEKPRSLLKLLDATHYNWEADKFRKIFGMTFKVKLPPLDQLNSIFYPQPDYALPIFLFFALVTKRKLIAHLNVYCPFTDDAYLARHVEPLTAILGNYASFDCADRYPDWMAKYRQPCSIYGMFPRDRFADVHRCALEYLGHYLQQAATAEKVTDPAALARIERFHARFVDDIRTQDKAQGMIARMIGKEKARRIFYEVTT